MFKTFTSMTALVALLAGASAMADGISEGQVRTHPSQGEVTVVSGATSRLSTQDEGIFVHFETDGLAPGHVHTLWLVTINAPAQCEKSDCTSKDVLKRSDAVLSDVGYAGGVVVGPDGTAEFAYYQPRGDLSGGWFGHGLGDPASAEVHLVVNDHGPLIDGRAHEMLSTYRDGCTDESIPAPMPATARAQGTPGPNTCRLVQFSIFKAAQPSS